LKIKQIKSNNEISITINPATGFRLPAIGFRLSATGYRLPATGYRLPASGYRLIFNVNKFSLWNNNAAYSTNISTLLSKSGPAAGGWQQAAQSILMDCKI
jgi:hypothetical protein